MLSTSRLALRNRPTVIVNAVVGRRYGGPGAARLVSSSRAKTSSSSSSSFQTYTSTSLVLAATLLCTADNINRDTINYNDSTAVAQCSAVPLGAEPVMLSPTKEEATGILFPSLCNGMSLAGCGVRVKWGFVKVSFVLLFGFYMRDIQLSEIEYGVAVYVYVLLYVMFFLTDGTECSTFKLHIISNNK